MIVETGSLKKWAIGNDLRTILLSNTGITSVVGTNIFPVIAPETTQGSFMVYYRDNYKLRWTKMGVTEDVCRVYITIVADKYDEAVQLAALSSSALVGQHQKTNNLVFRVDLVDSTESYEEGKYLEILLFEII